MRLHQVRKISWAEAKLICQTCTSSLNAKAVMSHNEHDWYDIRRMTEGELEDFVRDLLRAERALLQSGLMLPH
jgi:hypothetical protein